MAANDIPRAVSTVVGQVLGEHYFHHATLESLFMQAGAPGEVPEGSCVKKSVAWLKRASEDPSCDGLRVLGRVIEEFMEVEPSFQTELWRERKARVEKIIAQNNLNYIPGGHVVPVGSSMQARSLEQLLKERDLPALEVDFRRALDDVVADPPAAVTASCALLEALLKVYIEDEGLEMPSAQTVKPLWAAVQKHLALDPGRFEDDDIKKILSGLSSIVDGIGASASHRLRVRSPALLSPSITSGRAGQPRAPAARSAGRRTRGRTGPGRGGTPTGLVTFRAPAPASDRAA